MAVRNGMEDNPTPLANYILALLERDNSREELIDSCLDKLNEFLGDGIHESFTDTMRFVGILNLERLSSPLLFTLFNVVFCCKYIFSTKYVHIHTHTNKRITNCT